VVFASRAGSAFNLFTRAVDDSAAPRRLTSSPNHQSPGTVSSGGTLVFTDFDPSTGADIWAVQISRGAPHAIVRTLFDEAAPAISPDGTWLAYQSNESNRWEIYLRPFAGTGAAVPISAGGGTSPAWSRDGRTVYYAGSSGVMAVSLGPTPSNPAEIVRGPWIPRGTAPAGALLVERARGRVAGVDRVSVTLQWTRELQRLLPAAVVSSPK
jgi:hypothetical protein